MSNKSDHSLPVFPFRVLTKFGEIVATNLTILSLAGFSFMYLGHATRPEVCKPLTSPTQALKSAEGGNNAIKETIQTSSSWLCSFTGWSTFIGNMGNTCIEVVLIILFFEVRARKEMYNSVKKIFSEADRTKHIEAFHLRREEYSQQIHTSFRGARENQTIKLLSLVEDIHILSEEIGPNKISEKVCSGCHVKILILHPDSSLLKTFDKIGFAYDSSSSAREVYGLLPQRLEMIRKKVESERGKGAVKGSIEIRAHKDIFSSIGYYSDSSEKNYVWMYFSAGYDGIKYPAFQIRHSNLEKDFNLIDYVDKHFDHLWTLAAGHPILKIGSEGEMTTAQDIVSVFPRGSTLPQIQVNPEHDEATNPP